ncbi:MAG: type II toxin-antitoxin system HicA family toxin, partial [bacterium]
PPQKPAEVIKKLKKLDFEVDHATGSHQVLYKEGHPRPVVVPFHSRDLKKGTLAGILKQADVSREDYLSL